MADQLTLDERIMQWFRMQPDCSHLNPSHAHKLSEFLKQFAASHLQPQDEIAQAKEILGGTKSQSLVEVAQEVADACREQRSIAESLQPQAGSERCTRCNCLKSEHFLGGISCPVQHYHDGIHSFTTEPDAPKTYTELSMRESSSKPEGKVSESTEGK